MIKAQKQQLQVINKYDIRHIKYNVCRVSYFRIIRTVITMGYCGPFLFFLIYIDKIILEPNSSYNLSLYNEN